MVLRFNLANASARPGPVAGALAAAFLVFATSGYHTCTSSASSLRFASISDEKNFSATSRLSTGSDFQIGQSSTISDEVLGAEVFSFLMRKPLEFASALDAIDLDVLHSFLLAPVAPGAPFRDHSPSTMWSDVDESGLGTALVRPEGNSSFDFDLPLRNVVPDVHLHAISWLDRKKRLHQCNMWSYSLSRIVAAAVSCIRMLASVLSAVFSPMCHALEYVARSFLNAVALLYALAAMLYACYAILLVMSMLQDRLGIRNSFHMLVMLWLVRPDPFALVGRVARQRVGSLRPYVRETVSRLSRLACVAWHAGGGQA